MSVVFNANLNSLYKISGLSRIFSCTVTYVVITKLLAISYISGLQRIAEAC